MVLPTGVPYMIEHKIPINAQNMDTTTEEMITERKFLNNLIDDRAGNTTSALINREPTKFMATTITAAMVMAINKLYNSTLIPVAFAKVSSKVMENILL